MDTRTRTQEAKVVKALVHDIGGWGAELEYEDMEWFGALRAGPFKSAAEVVDFLAKYAKDRNVLVEVKFARRLGGI